MEELIAALSRLHSPHLMTERDAIRLYVRARWPHGLRCPRCGSACSREGIRIRCDECPARARRCRTTILYGTPLAHLRQPRLRALLLALRAFAFYPQGIAARVLARDLGIPRMTAWRHNHELRKLLPAPAALATFRAAATQVCGKRRRRRNGQMVHASPGFAVVGAYNAVRATATAPPGQGCAERMIAENLHTWLIGTHHGVHAKWLPRYCCEFASRSYRDPPMVVAHVATLLRIAPAA